MRGRKSEVYEGGIRSPLFVHWPGRFPARDVEGVVAAHIDLFPSLLDAAGVSPPAGVQVDGRSLLAAWRGEPFSDGGRTITIQSHRGDRPSRYHQFASITRRWKLVHNSGFDRDSLASVPAFALYDIERDPHEANDLSSTFPDTVRAMVQRYDAWFEDVSTTRPDNYAPPRIVVGHAAEPRSTLTRQDWRYPGTHGAGGWHRDALGYWLVDVAAPADYAIEVRFRAETEDGRLTLKTGSGVHELPLAPGDSSATLPRIPLSAGPQRIEVVLTYPSVERGPIQVDISRT
jgi:hypothetical protein